jgi:NADH:ubiquinone oxidoreductase subunit 3 (subunit A)
MQLLAFLLMAFGGLCVAMGSVAWLPFFSSDMRLDLVGVVVFIVGGSLFYLAGSWLEKRVPPEKTRTSALNPDDTSFITAMLKRDRRVYLTLGLVLVAFDAFMLFLLPPLEQAEDEVAHPWVVIFLVFATLLVIGAAGILFLYMSFRLRSVTATRLYGVLTKTPHKVTGLTVHILLHEHAPGKLGRQILAVIDVEGEELRTGVTEEQWSLLKQYIQLHNPKATYREVEHEVSGG